MRALDHRSGTLTWVPLELPELGPQEVRLQVIATGVNRADLIQRAGRYPAPKGASPYLGLECSGVVVAKGDHVSHLELGDEVCALLAGGAYATHVQCHSSLCLPIPNGIDPIHAAGLPEVFATAWLNLFTEGALQPGESVLLHAGASGVGTAAIQLCALREHPVWVTVGSEEKLRRCVSLGAEGGAIRHAAPWWDQLETTVDVIIDPVGGPYLEANLRMLNTCGRLVQIGLLGGRNAQLDLGRLLVKRLRIVGSVLRSRTVQEKAAILLALYTSVWPALESGQIRPIIDRSVSFDQAQQAHDYLQSNQSIGKVILRH